MADVFVQVPIFDRIISYLHVRDMCKFMRVNQRVYHMFLIPSYGSFLRRKKQEYLDELIAEKMYTFHIPRYGDMRHPMYINIRLPKVGAFLPSLTNTHKIQNDLKNNKDIVKCNAKNNRMLQNQMHKRYRKG